MIYIPNRETKIIKQTNRSKILGDWWSSFGIDLQSEPGIIRVSPRTKINTSSTNDADLGVAIGFIRFQSMIFTVAGTRVFVANGVSPNITFTEDASTNAQTDYTPDESDITFFNGILFTTTTDAVMSLSAASGGTWTSRDTLSGGTPHPMTVFTKYNRLYTADASDIIRSMNTSYTTADPGSDYAIDLGDGLTSFITCLASTDTDVWIGTMSRTSKLEGNIYQWDGKSAQVSYGYKLKAQGCMALVIRDNVPYTMDSNGILSKYNGTSFKEVGRLPVSKSRLKNINSLDNDRFIHPNGMIVSKDNTILCFINNEHEDSGLTIDENCASGVWEWSEENGFVHKLPLSYTTVSSSDFTDHGQNRVARVGGLADVNWPSTESARNGTLLMGAQYYTNASDTAYAIFLDDSNDTIQKYGYFVTSWIQAGGMKDTWQGITGKHRKLLDSTDRITLKYRTTEADPVYVTLTWVSSTSFTTTTNVSSYTGYEVEFLQGVGSGKCVHISSVSENGGTYTVTIDEAVSGGGGGTTAKARLQDWIKIIQIANQSEESFIENLNNVTSERFQLKCCMQFTGRDELHEIGINNQPHS